MPSKTNYKDFSARVKVKYPEYASMGDLSLAKMWVDQNPQYGEFVVFDEPTTQKKSPVGTTPGQPVGSQSALSGSQEPPARTGNLLEDLKSAPSLPRGRFAFQREDSEGLEVPFAKAHFLAKDLKAQEDICNSLNDLDFKEGKWFNRQDQKLMSQAWRVRLFKLTANLFWVEAQKYSRQNLEIPFWGGMRLNIQVDVS